MKIAPHNGSFHADEVFAIATLLLLDEPLEIVRTRDEALMATCDLRVDVGLRSDPATGDFDHHQRGGAGERPDGIRYASFGLVWKHYGERVCGDAAVAAKVDEKLVQIVDANDNGQTLFESRVDGVVPVTSTVYRWWRERMSTSCFASRTVRYSPSISVSAARWKSVASASKASRARGSGLWSGCTWHASRRNVALSCTFATS